MKAATSDRLIATTVKPICRAARMAAGSGAMPPATLRSTASIITMASSTTKPTEMASAISDRLSSENPAAHIATKVPASDSGTVRPAATVAVSRRRNRNTTPITSAMVITRVACMSATLARIVPVRSVSTAISIPAGIQRRRSGSTALMRSTVSMTLASACLVTVTSTAGRPSYQAAERELRVPCSMLARAPSFTVVPSPVRMTRLAKPSGRRICSLVAIVTASSGQSIMPTGESVLVAATAALTSSRAMPWAAMRPGSRRMRTAGCSAPFRRTSATPSSREIRWAITVSAAS